MTLLRALYLHIDDQTHLKPSTRAAYRYDARAIAAAHGGDAPLGRINWGKVIATVGDGPNRGAWHLTFRFMDWLGYR
jgi:hypothetical protein